MKKQAPTVHQHAVHGDMQPQHQAALGTPEHVAMVRRALAAARDGCQRCCRQHTRQLADTPAAALVLRRYVCLANGLPVAPGVGTPGEETELHMMATMPAAERFTALHNLLMALVESVQRRTAYRRTTAAPSW